MGRAMSDLIPSRATTAIRLIVTSRDHLQVQTYLLQLFILAALPICILLSVGTARAASSTEQEWDRDEEAQLRNASPAAADLAGKGELLLNSGRASDAETLLAQASALVPNNALVARRQCQALTALGQYEAAAKACRRALVTAPTKRDWARDMVAIVRPLMAAEHGPSPEQLREAIMITQALMQKVPNQKWPYVAQCEIAKGLGQLNALTSCDEQGQLSARERAKIKGAIGGVMVQRPRWYFWAAWLAVIAAGIATLLHAGWSATLKLPRRSATHFTWVFLVTCWLLVPSIAIGQLNNNRAAPGRPGATADNLGPVSINDKDPESSVPSPQQRDADPVSYAYFVMSVTERAENAFKRGDYTSALRYFSAFIKAVPNRSIGYVKLCTTYEAMGDWPHAVDSCRVALGHDGVTGQNYAKYAHLLLEHTPKLKPTDIQDLDAVVQHLQTSMPNDSLADIVDCEVGVKVHDKPRLQRCTAKLQVSAPTDTKTVTFQWAYAVERGDYAEAKSLLERMKQTAISPIAIERMEQATSLARPLWKRTLTSRWALIALALLVGVFGATVLKRRHQPAIAK